MATRPMPFWGILGPILSIFRPFVFILGRFVPIWGHFGADSPLLGSFWGDLGPF